MTRRVLLPRTRRQRITGLMLAVMLPLMLAGPARAQTVSPVPAAGQASPPTSSGTGAPEPSVPRSDVDRVKEALNRGTALNLREDRLRFYSQTEARAPQTFSQYISGHDLWDGGATKGGNPMTHQEFLSMVTPRDLYGSGGIQAIELLQFALTDWLGKTLIRRGLEEMKEAKTEREAHEIRERIERELAILSRSAGRSQ